MAIFALAIAAVKTAYDSFLTARAATVAAQQAIVDAGARPTYPNVVLIDADWNAITTSQGTWDTNNATLQATLVTAQGTQRTRELAVIAALGYGTGDTAGICLDQWVKVVGAGAGILTYTNYIGAATKSTYLTILTSLPTQAFPSF